ncbi:nitroreductase family deazaflavin-dependent oxidoreductase [Jiangella rhizosphaerae]|uniref:Nitroreductase family deazaflavin-dependent oxidoreductase n=1 Tax=Jiangella rhizosphaerae TaxID=2293569 RepID=A0A418KLP1_9ACTN|nr:nitroreductase family deazaflavin-dependent oxidoreductase [Jiangella rhizosphaerae]RIQ18842.1 nitroreductase family deazaflavin-dependent oxidoreductase [Jiangella rhizosphaerae]
MTNDTTKQTRPKGTPGRLSLWFQRRMNTRTVEKIRRKGTGRMMGMDVLVLHTAGRRSGQPYLTPIAWYPDGDGARLVVASGGGSADPNWYRNLTAHPDRVSVELPGERPRPVTPHTLDGAERDDAWQRIVAANPRFAKYQAKSERRYPIVRLTER